jgi:hypothetical protein
MYIFVVLLQRTDTSLVKQKSLIILINDHKNLESIRNVRNLDSMPITIKRANFLNRHKNLPVRSTTVVMFLVVLVEHVTNYSYQ